MQRFESREKNEEVEEGKSISKKFKKVNRAERALVIIVCLFQGLLNNLGYGVVAVSSSIMAGQMGKQHLMPLFQICLVAMGASSVYLNSKYFIRTPLASRIIGNVLIIGLAYILVISGLWAFTHDIPYAFQLVLIGTLMQGAGCTFGSAISLGGIFLPYPPKYISFRSAGNGIAGSMSGVIYLILKYSSFDLLSINLILFPTCLIYYVLCTFLLARGMQILNIKHSEIPIETNKSLTFANSIPVLPLIQRNLVNGSIGYFSTYLYLTCFADIIAHKENANREGTSFLRAEIYAFICLSFRVGEALGRSSLTLFKINKVEIISICISIQMIFWGCNAIYGITDSIPIIFLSAFIFGLTAGTSYINNVVQILNNRFVKPEARELASNIMLFLYDSAILGSAVLALILDNTVFKL